MKHSEMGIWVYCLPQCTPQACHHRHVLEKRFVGVCRLAKHALTLVLHPVFYGFVKTHAVKKET